MKAVMVMYDSLRFDYLPTYGGKQVELPNFKRLAKHTVQFENSYVCSMPCMPARRELHTGRANFLHRSWGPLEPFDDSMPELLKQHNIYTRIATDHNHYVEDGGASYMQRYNTWACYRGQEGDPWMGSAGPLPQTTHANPLPENAPAQYKAHFTKMHGQDMLNRQAMDRKEKFPQYQTFEDGLNFIQNNHQYDNWYMQIETFDPHEPFCTPDEFISRVCDPDTIGELDWPPYAPVSEPQEEIDSFKNHYLGLLLFCDESLGKVLDLFDEYNLWEDTMLIVNTDHGYMLGEHGWWSKGSMLDYQEVMRTPLFIYDPRSKKQNETRNALVQTIDLAPTLLEFFGVEVPKDMLGKGLRKTIEEDTPVREYALFGYHGSSLDITDGRYKLIVHVKEDAPQLYDYTLMPTHMRNRFSVEEMRQAEFVEGFSFTKGMHVLRIPTPVKHVNGLKRGEEVLFDLQEDPKELHPIVDEAVTKRLKEAMVALLKENDAPKELFEAYNL